VPPHKQSFSLGGYLTEGMHDQCIPVVS